MTDLILRILMFPVDLLWFVIIIHVLMSWLINFQVLNLHQPLVASIWDGLTRLLEPAYRPIRQFLPNTGALDLAPLVLFIGIIICRDILIINVGASLGCFVRF